MTTSAKIGSKMSNRPPATGINAFLRPENRLLDKIKKPADVLRGNVLRVLEICRTKEFKALDFETEVRPAIEELLSYPDKIIAQAAQETLEARPRPEAAEGFEAQKTGVFERVPTTTTEMEIPPQAQELGATAAFAEGTLSTELAEKEAEIAELKAQLASEIEQKGQVTRALLALQAASTSLKPEEKDADPTSLRLSFNPREGNIAELFNDALEPYFAVAGQLANEMALRQTEKQKLDQQIHSLLTAEKQIGDLITTYEKGMKQERDRLNKGIAAAEAQLDTGLEAEFLSALKKENALAFGLHKRLQTLKDIEKPTAEQQDELARVQKTYNAMTYSRQVTLQDRKDEIQRSVARLRSQLDLLEDNEYLTEQQTELRTISTEREALEEKADEIVARISAINSRLAAMAADLQKAIEKANLTMSALKEIV
jgi:hypothetical protein